MRIETLASTISDNFFYLLHATDEVALIDPVDAPLAIAAVQATGKRLRYVINTHWHPDHTAGNDDVLARFPGALLLCGPDAPLVSSDHKVDHELSPSGLLSFDDVELEVLLTPGHTDGHISLRSGDDLISGDVLFVAGAGNCRTGDPSVLFRTFRDVIGPMPDTVRFYPGHDYSRRNLEFALSLQPDLQPASDFLAALPTRSAPVLTTLGEERRYNPFLRAADPALQAALREAHRETWDRERAQSDDDAEATFRTTRALRNTW